ncbi:elongation factor P hydroxylase [uncultured Paraglaciecola sp.]|jgi:elongation factor P hydroxylase|uniref:elongation factor P hydroxylase n=1 Tax=uncultured Paraglaciecola sp. TaxID=1765024 RepID=UPI0026167699|nr:elongation factor P hydroxylase [uncultured Paraglaciecola sp.]
MNINTALSLKQTLCSQSSDGAILHNFQDLIVLFNATFTETENTVLVKGDHEPIYIPAQRSQHHQIVFAHGYFASALHEIAHWCIAGKQRRLLEDYGYWYSPDGRDMQQQVEFEKVEVKPQAIEWAFSCVAGKPFTVSTDNLKGAAADIQGFQNAVKRQIMLYLEYGFPTRAAEFMGVLQKFYQTDDLQWEMFDVESA